MHNFLVKYLLFLLPILVLGIIYFCFVALVTLFIKFPSIYADSIASVLTGFAAILAACIAFYSLNKQIKLQQEQASLESMHKQYDGFLKLYQFSSALCADISALLKLLETTPFAGQYTVEQIINHAEEDDQAPLITIEENFLAIFDSLSNQMVLEGHDLTYRVFYWYTRARGFIDQVKYNMKYLNLFDRNRKGEIIKGMFEDCEFFKAEGTEIIKILDLRSKKYFDICLKYDHEIGKFISKTIPGFKSVISQEAKEG